MTLISYRGELAAIAGPRRLLFACLDLDAAPDSDPQRRFVLAMGLFAHDVERGRRAGWCPSTHSARPPAAAPSSSAAGFNAMLEQVRQRRAELGLEYLLRSQPRA